MSWPGRIPRPHEPYGDLGHATEACGEYGNVFWPHGDNFIWLHSSPRVVS